MKRTASLALPATLLAGLLTGCGGGRVAPDALAAGQGRATITVHWPARTEAASGTRLIPAGANSIRVSFLSGTTEVKNTLLVRPGNGNGNLPTSTTVVDLPEGSLSVVAQAFPSGDGTGTPQAGGNTIAQIAAGKSTRVSLTLGSTIARVAILPETVQLTGNPVTINATAFDAQGDVVLTNSWTWQNSQPSILSLVPDGANATITARRAGSSIVTITETESGKSTAKQFNVTVIGG
jgi:hypothetical protein